MNTFMSLQINNMLTNLQLFEEAVKMAALKDDKVISKKEEKQIQKIKKVTAHFRKELEKIKSEG